jgi:hypothetical protein
VEAVSIKTRLSIGREEQGGIAFIYEHNLFKLINVPEYKVLIEVI